MLIEPASKVSVPLVDVILTLSNTPARVTFPDDGEVRFDCDNTPLATQIFPDTLSKVIAPEFINAAPPAKDINPVVDVATAGVADAPVVVETYPVVCTVVEPN